MSSQHGNAKKTPAVLHAWQGLGDTIYLRPSLRALAERHELYVATTWPELLEDLDLHLVAPLEHLYRTQAVNIASQNGRRWASLPAGAFTLEPAVHWSRPLAIAQSIALSVGLDPKALTFDLPSFPRPAVAPDRPYAVVRPVTVRREWPNRARNPDPRYVAAAAATLQDRGLVVVSVAHLEAGEEWALEPLPPADVTLHAGELTVTGLLGLTQHAELVVGGPGWLVPAAAAQRVPALTIGGGQGHYNAPERLVGPPMSGASMRWILPDAYCRKCRDPGHACSKAIDGFEAKLERALEELLGVGVS